MTIVAVEAANGWRLSEAWDLDTKELIVDEVAIRRAVNGQRAEGPWITKTEALAAFEIMRNLDFTGAEIADNIGCDLRTVNRWIAGDTGEPARAVLGPKNTPARDLSPERLAARRAYKREASRLRRAALKAAAFAV